MTKPMLWITASIFLAIAVALFTFLLWEKLPPLRAGSLAPSDFINLLTALLTLVGLAIALGSFYVAVAAYQKSVKDGEEQQKNLDVSRAQLQAVVDAAIKQQEVLTKNLETSKAQLGLLEEQWKREQERQARKPIAEIALQTTAGAKTLDDLAKLPEIEFPLEKDRKWSRTVFLVVNKGNSEISGPLVRIVAFPETVFIDAPDFRLAERVDHNAFQFSGPTVNDIDPVDVAGGPYKYAVDITVPDSINAFDLTFTIQGKNLARKAHTLHLKVTRPSS